VSGSCNSDPTFLAPSLESPTYRIPCPPDSKLEGQNIMNWKDPNGTAILPTFTEALKTQNSAWVEYLWPKPGSDKPVKKFAYVRKTTAPTGETLIVGSGFYPE
jgi:methyl-accepting chemotaxis protein